MDELDFGRFRHDANAVNFASRTLKSAGFRPDRFL